MRVKIQAGMISVDLSPQAVPFETAEYQRKMQPKPARQAKALLSDS
jgi:hypothetical protein